MNNGRKSSKSTTMTTLNSFNFSPTFFVKSLTEILLNLRSALKNLLRFNIGTFYAESLYA